MIVLERFGDFVDSLDEGFSPELEELYEKALEEGVPVIRRQTASLIRFILTEKDPRHILEIGTAVGFSALFMSEHVSGDASVTTIEKVPARIAQAKENFARFDRAGMITLLEGDACDILKGLEDESFDMIFMDAAKGQYLNFLPDVKRVLVPGGILISDNVLSDGQIIQSRFAVTRRDRTIHKRMREYLFEICHDRELVTTVLTVGDGTALTYRKGKKKC